MSVHKNEKNGTWYVMVRYTDWQGNYKQKCKRGFATRQEGGCKYDAGKLLCPLRGRS